MDLLNTKPQKAIIGFAIPIFLGMLFQQIYNTTDAIIIGRLIGQNEFTSVSTCSSAFYLILALTQGFGTGAGILIGRLFGEGNKTALCRCYKLILLFAFSLGLVISVVGTLICPYILEWINTPTEYFENAVSYLKVLCMGSISFFAFNLLSSILNSLGLSRPPVYALIFSSLLNIALDFLFILLFEDKLQAVALATVAAQLCGAILLIIFINHKVPMLRNCEKGLCFDLHFVRELISFGAAAGLQQLTVGIGRVLLQALTNDFGGTTMTASFAAGKIDGLAIAPLLSLGVAATAYASQNYGNKNEYRIKEGIKELRKTNLAIAAALCLIITLGGKCFLNIVLPTNDDETVRLAYSCLACNIICFPLIAVTQVYLGYLRGLGNIFFTSLVSIAVVVFRIPISTFFAYTLGMQGHGIWWGYIPVLLGALFAAIWKYHQRIKELYN